MENDGDDFWITVTNGYCKSFDCLVGSNTDGLDVATCVETAYNSFYPAQYVSENLEPNDNPSRVLCLAQDAYEIDRVLEMAMSA